MADAYALWRSEIDQPTPEDRRADRPTDPRMMSGFWRITAARTKIDQPLAIWTREGDDVTIFQIGAEVFDTLDHQRKWQQFLNWGWVKCVAVSRSEWQQALDGGKWSDGKPAREQTIEQKADIIPDTPAEQGGNMGEGPSYAEQLDAKIKALLDKARAIGKVDSAEKGKQAAEIASDLKALFDLGEAQRKAEKKPFDDGAKAVQAKWLPILEPASKAREWLVNAIDLFRRAEQRRLQAEADAKAEAERQRIAAETAARMKAEAEASARLAEQMGMEAQTPTDEEIEAEAEQVAAETVVAEKVAAPRVGPEYGRAVSKARRRGGRIVDAKVFAVALVEADDDEMLAALQKRADQLARSKVKMAGYEIEED